MATNKDTGFTAEERAAMKERAKELKKARSNKADGESDLLAKIAEMPEPDRLLAERIHALVKDAAPALAPRTWYGMPAYARDGVDAGGGGGGQSARRAGSTLSPSRRLRTAARHGHANVTRTGRWSEIARASRSEEKRSEKSSTSARRAVSSAGS